MEFSALLSIFLFVLLPTTNAASSAASSAAASPAPSSPAASSGGGPTKIFIDSVTEYHLLSTCAEEQLSTIIRDMSYGCGDGSKTTSWACFCFESSLKFSDMISRHVVTSCSNDSAVAQASSAVEVFNSYCHLGEVAAPTTAANSPSSSTAATPASGPSTVFITATPSHTADPKKSSNTNVAAIAAGVTIPVVVIGLGIAAILLFRRHRRNRGQREPIELAGGDATQLNEASGGRDIRELKEETLTPTAELASDRPFELDSPKKHAFGAHGYEAHELDSRVVSDARPDEKR